MSMEERGNRLFSEDEHDEEKNGDEMLVKSPGDFEASKVKSEGTEPEMPHEQDELWHEAHFDDKKSKSVSKSH